jgi:hypothetical protein
MKKDKEIYQLSKIEEMLIQHLLGHDLSFNYICIYIGIIGVILMGFFKWIFGSWISFV